MDPLSDLLSLLKPRFHMAGGIDAGGEWSINFGRHRSCRCIAFISGHCWLLMEGVSDAVYLQAGDCIVLPHGREFRLASDLSLPPVDFMTVISGPLQGLIRVWNGGGACMGINALFTFEGEHVNTLLAGLPPVVHIKKNSDRTTTMRWCLERMMKELREPQPGGVLLGQHLSHMILIEALRLYVGTGVKGGIGWLYALADQQMGAIITCMHENPGHRWNLEELAERIGMSRSVFAQRFKETVGSTPMDYLTKWRMLLAGDRLNTSDEPIHLIAESVGYDSESAFAKSFRRVMGCSPREYRRGASMDAPKIANQDGQDDEPS